MLRLSPGLDEGDAGARQIAQGTDAGRRDKARPDEPMRQQLGNPAGIRLVHLPPRPPLHLLRMAYDDLHGAHKSGVDRFPVPPWLSRATMGQCASTNQSNNANNAPQVVADSRMSCVTCPVASVWRRHVVRRA
jgi:hypothetical protein